MVSFLNVIKRSESLAQVIHCTNNAGKLFELKPPEDLYIIINSTEIQGTFDSILALLDEEQIEQSWVIFTELVQLLQV